MFRYVYLTNIEIFGKGRGWVDLVYFGFWIGDYVFGKEVIGWEGGGYCCFLFFLFVDFGYFWV